MSAVRKGANGLPVRSAPAADLLPFTDDPRVNRGTADEFDPRWQPIRVVDDCDAGPDTFASALDWPDWTDDLVVEFVDDGPEMAAGRGVPLLTSTLGKVS